MRAAALYRDASGPSRSLPRAGYLLVIVLLAVALVGFAVLFSGIPQLALGTAAGILGALLLLALSARGIRALSRRLARSRWVRGRTALRTALGAVGGPGSEATSVVLSLGLGLAVLASVGQIDANLRAAIQRDLPQVAPSYFFVDIQPDQLQPFLDRVENDPAVTRVDTAPDAARHHHARQRRARDRRGRRSLGHPGRPGRDLPADRAARGGDHRWRVVARRL